MSRLPRPSAVLRLLVLAGLVLGSTGCARLFSSYDVAPNGMARRDDTLRQLLVAGRADSALVRVEPKGASAPEDELLRALYSGLLGHYAGSYDSSSAALQRAAELADDRYTKRISRAALSLVTNDKVLPYEPSEAERLLIHYYAGLNYLRQDDLVGATVEARRLGLLLERDDAPRDSTLHGWLRYFSGLVFEAAGERNDAEVAYRNARALLGARAELPGLDSTGVGVDPPGVRGARDVGEVVVLVEEGFVAHRVEQAITVPLFSFEMDRLSGGDTGSRLGAAAEVSARVLVHALAAAAGTPIYYGSHPRTLKVAPLPPAVAQRECEAADTIATKGSGAPPPRRRPEGSRQPDAAPVATPSTVTGSAGGMRGAGRRASPRSSPPRSDPGRSPAPRSCANLSNPYILRIAWPVFRQERTSSLSWQVVTAANSVQPQLRSGVTSAVARDFEAERGAILTRTILRGVTKAVVTRSIERAPGENAAGLGQLLGVLANLGTALLEQADTRSWQLLPDRLGVVRLQLPPGEHEIALEVRGSGGVAQRIELGKVRVRAGAMSFLSARVFQ